MLEAQGFHLGFVEGDEAHKEPQKRKDDGFGKGLVREDARCEKEASDEGDEVCHFEAAWRGTRSLSKYVTSRRP